MSSSRADETVFASGKLLFPKLKDGKLDTLKFLDAAKGVVSLVGKNHLYNLS